MSITKPMLAATIEPDQFDKLRFPLLATPKIDGIRCLKIAQGRVVTRTFKPIPNLYIRELLNELLPVGADGEIYVPGGEFKEVSSKVMTQSGKPLFHYAMFDYIYCGIVNSTTYVARINHLKMLDLETSIINRLFPIEVKNWHDLDFVETKMLKAGFEGVMLRSPDSLYKCGRSTFNEHYLMKLKRFHDSEAVIIGFEELEHNYNEATIDAFGNSKRSSHKENKTAAGVLGAFIVKDINTKVEFKVGTGFDQVERIEYWLQRKLLLGKIIKYKSQLHGADEKPRFPTFLGFRNGDDK